jgi:hypothetical protein
MNKYALLMLAAVNVSMGSHFEGSRVQHDAVTESTLGRHLRRQYLQQAIHE